MISTGSTHMPGRKGTMRPPVVVTDQDKEAPASPINIQIASSKSPVKKKKNKLLEMMIKTYEEEKMRAKLTKVEKDFMAEIDNILGPDAGVV